jgi:hypothetical protein
MQLITGLAPSVGAEEVEDDITKKLRVRKWNTSTGYSDFSTSESAIQIIHEKTGVQLYIFVDGEDNKLKVNIFNKKHEQEGQLVL